MQFSVNHLKQWVALDLDAEALAERLTQSGLEVDRVVPVAAPFSGVVVAEITAVEPHPDADKLVVCRVDDGGDEPLQVVCGAPNARPGLKAPLARVGAVLGEDFKVGKAKLRGVASAGMLCSARELGLSDDHSGLMELPADAPVGEDFREWLRLDDHSIEVELTPNRGDCLGLAGLARDVAASCAADYTPLEIPPVPTAIDDTFPVRLDDPEACALYVGRVIRGIDPEVRTPLWMVEALRRAGHRSISPVVDATNYVMLELGQPMHAFDLGRLKGGIHVRYGKKNERLTLLDGKEVALDDGILAICDESGPVALGGIMGGLGTSVTENTRDIFIECAWFAPEVISGKARTLGLHTDASHRFERGVNPRGQVAAVERITALLLDMVGGTPGPVEVTESPEHLPQQAEVTLRLERLNRVLGSDLTREEVDPVFGRLGFEHRFADGAWQVTAPPARYDIAIEEDLIEEVARIYGYNQLPTAKPSGELSPHQPPEREVPLNAVRHALAAAGYDEAINYSFVDPGLLDTLQMSEGGLPLANPISAEMGVMRTALLPGLLTALRRNLRRQHERVRLFETGVVFDQRDEVLDERRHVAAVASGDAWPEQWGLPGRAMDFHDLKGDLEAVLALRGTMDDVECVPDTCPWLHPGQSARVRIGNQDAGWIGMLHPAMQSALDLRQPVFAFELDHAILAKRELPFAKEISKYPSIRRDLALLVPEQVSWAEIRSCVENVAGDLLVNLLIFDLFKGKAVEKAYKSITIALILQDVCSTLTDEVVDPLIQEVIKGLESRLGAQLRG